MCVSDEQLLALSTRCCEASSTSVFFSSLLYYYLFNSRERALCVCVFGVFTINAAARFSYSNANNGDVDISQITTCINTTFYANIRTFHSVDIHLARTIHSICIALDVYEVCLY